MSPTHQRRGVSVPGQSSRWTIGGVALAIAVVAGCAYEEGTPIEPYTEAEDGIDDSFADAKVDGVTLVEGHWVTRGVLRFTNEASFEVLRELGIARRPATNIVLHRDGGDARLGSPDDDLFDTLAELDAIPYVGVVALSKLHDAAKARGYLVSPVLEDDGRLVDGEPFEVEVPPQGDPVLLRFEAGPDVYLRVEGPSVTRELFQVGVVRIAGLVSTEVDSIRFYGSNGRVQDSFSLPREWDTALSLKRVASPASPPERWTVTLHRALPRPFVGTSSGATDYEGYAPWAPFKATRLFVTAELDRCSEARRLRIEMLSDNCYTFSDSCGHYGGTGRAFNDVFEAQVASDGSFDVTWLENINYSIEARGHVVESEDSAVVTFEELVVTAPSSSWSVFLVDELRVDATPSTTTTCYDR